MSFQHLDLFTYIRLLYALTHTYYVGLIGDQDHRQLSLNRKMYRVDPDIVAYRYQCVFFACVFHLQASLKNERHEVKWNNTSTRSSHLVRCNAIGVGLLLGTCIGNYLFIRSEERHRFFNHLDSPKNTIVSDTVAHLPRNQCLFLVTPCAHSKHT